MALPKEHATELMSRLRATILEYTPEQMTALPPFSSDDYEMVGHYIQSYNFIDLNLRRALSMFHATDKLPEQVRKGYPDFQDAQLADCLIAVLNHVNLPESELTEAVGCLNQISEYRAHRNILGHWAGKRYPGEDVFVFANKTDRNARRTLGRSLAALNIQIAVTGRSEFRVLTSIVVGLSDWLSRRIPSWYDLSIR